MLYIDTHYVKRADAPLKNLGKHLLCPDLSRRCTFKQKRLLQDYSKRERTTFSMKILPKNITTVCIPKQAL